MVTENAFVEIAAILGLATLTGIVGQKLRQPLIIMFLATGILAGPSFLGIIQSYEQIELLAHTRGGGDHIPVHLHDPLFLPALSLSILGTLDMWRKSGVPVLYGDMADPEISGISAC
jgi:NhaP-type Na+/H+ or K+/H+ antiporter